MGEQRFSAYMKMMRKSMFIAGMLMAWSVSAVAAGDVAKGQEIAGGVCAGCHGLTVTAQFRTILVWQVNMSNISRNN